LIVGVIFAIWSNIDLLRIGKGGPTDIFNIAISPRTKKLVISGPYRYTRNPMVFGMNSIYFAIAVYLNSLISLIFVILFLLVITIYLRLAEEKRLLKDFGNEYLEYKRNVSMIIPFLSKKTNK
jgi:protein-S-isoprenylcysteine O-methyltransferase Ste14